MESYANAGDGLKKMYFAQWGFIICAVLGIIPVINVVAAVLKLVVSIVSLLGLYAVSKDIPECKNALYLTIASMIITILAMIIKAKVASVIFSVFQSIAGLLVSYYVCNPVADVMQGVGAADIAANGRNVWKINMMCYIASIIISVISLIPLVNILAILLNVIVAIVQLVALILYMSFLNKSYQKLMA